MGFVGGKK